MVRAPAVCALAKALFGSLPAAELQYRLSLRDTPRRQRITRLNWEINNRLKWDEDVARGSPHATAVRLSDPEIESKRRELQRLTRTSLAWRAFTYFMGCFACQSFWTAVATDDLAEHPPAQVPQPRHTAPPIGTSIREPGRTTSGRSPWNPPARDSPTNRTPCSINGLDIDPLVTILTDG